MIYVTDNIMTEKLLKDIAKYGENDGVCTRLYIDVVKFDGYDCLAVGFNNEMPNRLIGFFQDENDDNFHTRDIDGIYTITQQIIIRKALKQIEKYE